MFFETIHPDQLTDERGIVKNFSAASYHSHRNKNVWRFVDKCSRCVRYYISQFKTHYEYFTRTSNASDILNNINVKECHLTDKRFSCDENIVFGISAK